MGEEQISLERIPTHLAIIMDGNGRWAEQRGHKRIEGHKEGAKSVRAIVEQCARLGVRYLTLFSFSTENWGRKADEVSGLMSLFRQYLDSELETLLGNQVRLRAIGQIERLPFPVRAALSRNIESTKNNTRLDLILALSYGGREEILVATRKLATMAAKGEIKPEQINEEVFENELWSAGIPDPDLLIRTSGELRISNFLLWQLAYSEIVIAPELWPDFREEQLLRCLKEFQLRERRFGLTSAAIA